MYSSFTHSVCDSVSGGQRDGRCGPPYLTQAGSWPCPPGALGKLDYGETQGDREITCDVFCFLLREGELRPLGNM